MKNCLLLLIVISFMGVEVSFGHGDEKHDGSIKAEVVKKPIKDGNQDIFRKINISYENKIKPLIENSCFNCHSQKVNYPWYYKLPLIKSMIDEDIRMARKHLLFDGGFPFKGHGEPIKDLKAIAKAVDEGSMPPLEYVIMHPSAYLNDTQRSVIQKWTQDSLELLK